jgi:hypothetical protein
MTASRPRVAAITTVWRKDSHADVLISKLLAGYDLDAVPIRPSVDVVSLYVDQFPENDLSRRWAARFGVPICGSVADALTLGMGSLAVDAVLIVGEHGEYPWNEQGQHLYPRRELFEQAVDVIRPSGRAVPIFNDKHLSYSWESARWMYETAREVGLPLMAGSSLPVTYRVPDLNLPLGARVEEALVISHGPTESYGFHALETLQCMVERRAGGETGVAAVETLHGDSFWAAWEAGRFPLDLYEVALATAEHGAGGAPAFYRHRPAAAPSYPGPHPPVAFLVEYWDGLRATLLNLHGYVADFAFAARVDPETGGAAGAQTVATAFKLERHPPRWHFNFLAHHIEQFVLTGLAPYPVERTLLTTGALAALMDAAHAGRRLDTPHLAIAYRPPMQPWLRSSGRSLPPGQVWGFEPEEV